MLIYSHSNLSAVFRIMYHAKKFSTLPMVHHKSPSTGQLITVGSCGEYPVENPSNSGRGGKQRLRWTSDLHDRFVDAIAQLGGPDSEYFITQ